MVNGENTWIMKYGLVAICRIDIIKVVLLFIKNVVIFLSLKLPKVSPVLIFKKVYIGVL